MTHYFDSVAFGNIEGVNALFGASVDIPTSFFKSGYSNLYNISVGKVSKYISRVVWREDLYPEYTYP